MKKTKTFIVYYKRWEYKEGNLDKNVMLLKLVNTSMIGIKHFSINMERGILTYQKGNVTKELDLKDVFIKEIRISPEGV